MNHLQQRSQRNTHQWAAICLGICALPLATLAGCGDRNHKPEIGQAPAGPTRVETVTVTRQDLAQSIEMSGTIEGDETVDLYAKVGGFLEEITVDIGDRVEAGQVLARLSIPEMAKELDHQQASFKSAQAMVQQTEAGIRQAEARIASGEAAVDEAKTQRSEKEATHRLRQAEFERTKELVDSGSLLAKKLDEAKFNLEAAAAALKSADARIRSAEAELVAVKLDVEKARFDSASAESRVTVAIADLEKTKTMNEYATIRAPFAGLVTKRMVDPGAFIQPAEGNSGAKPLLTVTATSVVRLRIDLPMDEVQWLDRGDRAVFGRINALPGETVPGTVTRYSSTLDPTSRTMRVEIDLPNADHRLSPGYYGYVTLILNEFKDVPTVPSSAVMTDDEGLFVYVLEGSTCKRRAVTTNFADGAIVGIASGLAGGETVVRSGGGQLSDGQQVATANSPDGSSP
ncbi:MAG: efflux RND transporter periplasmic adaptor subunit [Planctomycetota bacterium]|nr:efflux RND transporter periplasmic adaptor subunit [Planctomycetota bacterium]